MPGCSRQLAICLVDAAVLRHFVASRLEVSQVNLVTRNIGLACVVELLEYCLRYVLMFVCPVRGRSRRAVNEGRKVAVRSLLMAKFHGHSEGGGWDGVC